jgi:hypothetical protein
MGRPPIGERAISAADAVAKLEARVRELEAELARESATHMKTCANDEAKLKVRKGGGLWTRNQYNTVVFCLHPDQRDKQSEERLNAAFRIVSASEQFIVLKKDRGGETVARKKPKARMRIRRGSPVMR